MTTPAANIDQAIAFCADNIAQLSYDGVVAIKTRMDAWIAAMFADGGVFPPANYENDGQRRVIDWRGPSMNASTEIEGTTAGSSGVIGTSAAIDAVVRVLCAVKATVAANQATVAQRTATVAAFNAQWT